MLSQKPKRYDTEEIVTALRRGEIVEIDSRRPPDFLKDRIIRGGNQCGVIEYVLFNLSATTMSMSFVEMSDLHQFVQRKFARRINPDGTIGGFFETTARAGLRLVRIGENVTMHPQSVIIASAPFTPETGVHTDVYANMELLQYYSACGGMVRKARPGILSRPHDLKKLSEPSYELYVHGPIATVGGMDSAAKPQPL